MRDLWTSLNIPQAIVLAFALVAFFAGAVPPIVECATHIIETVICLIAGPRMKFLPRPFTPEEKALADRLGVGDPPREHHSTTCKGCINYDLGCGPCDECRDHDGWRPKEEVA